MGVEVEDLIGLWDVAFPSPSPSPGSADHTTRDNVNVQPGSPSPSPSPSPTKPHTGQTPSSPLAVGGPDAAAANKNAPSAGTRPPSPAASVSPSSTSHRSLSLSATAPAFQPTAPSTPKTSSSAKASAQGSTTSAKGDRLDVVRSRSPPSFFAPAPPPPPPPPPLSPPRAQMSDPATSPVLSPRVSKAVRISPPATKSVSLGKKDSKTLSTAIINLIDAYDESDDTSDMMHPTPGPNAPSLNGEPVDLDPSTPTSIPSRNAASHDGTGQDMLPSQVAQPDSQPNLVSAPVPASASSGLSEEEAEEPEEPAKVHRATRLSISSPTHPPVLVSPRVSPIQATFQPPATVSGAAVGDEPQAHAVSSVNEEDAFMDDIADFEEQWEAFLEAFGGFSGGAEEFIARVKDHFRSTTSSLKGPVVRARRGACKSPEDPSRAAADTTPALVIEQRATIARQEDQIADIRGLLQVAKADLERVKVQREKDQQALDLWEGRATQLASQHLELEKRHEEVEKALADNKAAIADASFGMVILDADPRLFGSDILANGRAGGRDIFAALVECLVGVFDELPPLTYVYLFIDVTRVAKSLIDAGWIERHADLQDVLDGFSSSNELCFVIDALEDGQGCGPRQKLLAHFLACARNPVCKWTIVGAVDESGYRPVLSLLDDEAQSRLYFVRSSEDIDAEPFAKWGSGRMLAVPGLYTLPEVPRRAPTSQASNWRPVTPSGKSEYSSSLYSSSQPPDSPPPTPKPRIAPPPWERREEVAKAPPPSSVGGSLQDQYWASKSAQRPDDGASTSLGLQIRGRASRDARSVTSVDRSPTPRGTDRQRQGSRVAYRIPVHEGDDGSIGGSPPSSDEDNPAVRLPHSAVKHVQRPTTAIEVSPSRTGSVVPSTTAISALELPGRAASLASRIHPSRAGQITASRPAPLPSKTAKAAPAAPSARSTGTNGVPMGKSKYGNLGNDAGERSVPRSAEGVRAEMKARRSTTEYN